MFILSASVVVAEAQTTGCVCVYGCHYSCS